MARLVALQVTDEMPGHTERSKRGNLWEGFLDVAFAEIAAAGGESGTDGLGGLGFGNGDQRDFAAIPL